MIASISGKSPIIPASAWVAPSADVMGEVTLGEHVSVWFGVVLRGDVHSIHIGDYTNVQDGTVIHVTHGGCNTVIGKRVTIGHKALIHACSVGDDCLIGMGSIMLDGVEVGSGSVVAAGALLTPGKKYPPNSMIMGYPAKAVREITPKERAEMIDQGWKNYHAYVQDYKKTFRVLS
jgi:carbonic anhydrase/acetyltransferase-like protein (isoleucine patch superfamily)